MRTSVFLPTILLAFASPALAGDEKKDAIKIDLSYLEKTWGVKYKSHKTEASDLFSTRGPIPYSHERPRMMWVRIVMEFSKDAENLDELRRAIGPSSLQFYLFDEDNVLVSKMAFRQAIEGELTGVAGDAFRVSLMVEPGDLQKTRKIAARPKK